MKTFICLGSEDRPCDKPQPIEATGRNQKRCPDCAKVVQVAQIAAHAAVPENRAAAIARSAAQYAVPENRATHAIQMAAWYTKPENKTAVLTNQAIRRVALKSEVFSYYCGGRPHCQCPGCFVTVLTFLSIDHINGDGHNHLNKKGKKLEGPSLLVWLKRNNYPEGFQVLCFNCNGAKRTNPRCPRYGQDHTKE